MIQGKIQPYAFHMNWNSDKDTKRKFIEQLGNWFVNVMCIGKSVEDVAELSPLLACCAADPVVACHFRDKPSKVRCDDSPMIEDKKSFW